MIIIGPVTIDFTPLINIANDPLAAAWFLLVHGGWVAFLLFFGWMAKMIWFYHIWRNYVAENLRPVILAIDVPKRSIQTPKAVENIFSHLAGAHGSMNRREIYLQGKVQEWFSLEIVSIDGYVQFLVWTWDKFRDLAETAIYAQYPDAQITEVEDYTTAVPHRYPNSEWDLWGTEFVFANNQAYPLRTWMAFEHAGQKDEPFKDPLAAMLESMARLASGEQIWLQILLRPINQGWQKKANELVNKLIGKKAKKKELLIEKTIGLGGKVAVPIVEQMLGTEFAAAGEKKRDEPESKILYLAPGERAAVEAIEMKTAKIGFEVKIRAIYVARTEVFKKQHGAHAIIGSIKQLNTNDLNSLKPDFKHVGPSSLWLWKSRRNSWRKTKLARAYSLRSMYVGKPTFVMNIEELATLWHFPTAAVHAPLISRTDARRAVPPSGLPVERVAPLARPFTSPVGGGAAEGPPQGLPVV